MQQLLKHPFLDPNRYNDNDADDDDDSMHFIDSQEETTPTPSSIDTLSDYYYDITDTESYNNPSIIHPIVVNDENDIKSCNNTNDNDDNDTDSTLSSSIVNFRGFDICAQGNKNYKDVTNVNNHYESNNNNNLYIFHNQQHMNIIINHNNNLLNNEQCIPSRVEAMKSASDDDNDQVIEPTDDLITPRIGTDGMFKFGINNDHNSTNDTAPILRYHF
eukprot:CAMPEP_0201570322 /NCGR_PEP_ID=MMETSP0190_2-20130828/12530_1 /ASSEMBLY_ACC=CAM_ASM_000263 /TAXON_ID=37353 /ORGANISM="Rosalina sp." /LENGTH=216 /DNA_ID=CAMNT_0047993741 /DNA_START=1341 /DNA_END=1991 /DNA_ORIENTATION=-